jgi:hypothetical protein
LTNPLAIQRGLNFTHHLNLNIMQSEMRKFKRVNNGLQNLAPSSIKIAKNTPALPLNYGGERYRKGRFNQH